jgi:hypothetical protein
MRIVLTNDSAAAPTPAPAPQVAETRSLRLEAHGGPHTRPLVDTSYERREHLERELDRVQNSLLAERNTYGQQLNWLMLSQALLLNAFLFVLILGWSTPLPAKRLLLAGLAVFAAAVAVLIVLALRGTRDAVISLHQHRKSLEATLQKDFGRDPVFASRAIVTRGLASAANGLLPATFVAGWIALTIYALAAPLGGTAEAGPNTAAPTVAPGSSRPTARTPERTASAVPFSPPTADATTGSGQSQVADASPVESGLASPARRAGGFKW